MSGAGGRALKVCGLLTDFGAGSGYPAQMKARLLCLVPAVRLVDIGHEVPPFDVTAGALLLEEAAAAFPPGSVVIAVVDPGVGTARRGLAVVGGPRAPGRFFVGPDNGLLARMAEGGVARVLPPAPPDASPTFHGRDVFVPAAARLLRLGRRGLPSVVAGTLAPSPLPSPRSGPGGVRGVTLAADRFGNVVTSLRREDLPAPPWSVWLGRRRAAFVRTFGDERPGTVVAYLGSGGRLELAVVEGSLARRLRRARGVPVVVRGRRGS